MSTTRKTPKLRFPEFTDDWEQRKLGDITDSFSGGTPKVGNEEYYGGEIPFIRSAEINSSTTELYITKKGLDNSSAKMVSKGTILYALYGATSGECGISQIDGAINQAILAIKPKCGYVPYFISTWLRRSKFSIVSTFLQGGQGNLSGEIVKNLSLMLPCQNEQKKIGELFKKLDSTITLHQRELDSLKKLKKSLLQKMFPKNGEKIPELRFPEFTGDWEQRKLSDIGNIITGSTPSTKDKNNYNGDFLFVSPADIQGNRFVEKTITTLSELGFKKGRILAPKSTLFVSIGSTIGKVAQIRDFAVTNQQINSIEPFKDIDPDFVFSLMQKESPSIRCLSATQAVPILNKTTFSNVEVSIASNINEQYRIGELFIKLDSTITLHQRELDTLKKLKKGLLQNMFV